MKNIWYTLIPFLFAGLLLWSCGQGGEDNIESYFDVTPATISVDAYSGQEWVTVRSNEDWLIRSDQGWVRPVVSSGKASSEPVRISVVFDANPDNSPRNATLTVKTLKGKSFDIAVDQQARGEGDVEERGIASAADLVAFASAVNEGTSLSPFMNEGVIVLLNDIDASSIKEWIPAGTSANPFMGTFDGRGHAITNINWTVDASASGDIGILGYVKGAVVRNLVVGKDGDKITVSGSGAAINAAAVVGVSDGGEISGCSNVADIFYDGASSGENIRIAGICGYSANAKVSGCTNSGNVMSASVSRTAGFVAYNEGKVTDCTNEGSILSGRSGETGAAWGCSYNKTPDNFADNTGNGHVGDYDTYKSDPESAPSDAYLNAVSSPARGGYTLESVTIDWTKDSYYDWTEVESRQIASSVKYTKYTCDNVPRMINVLEIDLSDPSVEVTTSYANDCVPNPNGNKNSNNGFNIRETLSQLCTRKRAEGQKIIAGINTGFFDSNDGISRGFHVEDGCPVYINNPYVVNALPNHSWAFTVFTDGTASCGKKTFSGKIEAGGKEFEWLSLNDTIMRHTSSSYQINLYDCHYKQYPHPSVPTLVNKLAADALYVIAEYTDSPMKVNTGYAAAKVISILDGRTTPIADLPYITSENQIGISLSGTKADSFRAYVSVGDEIKLRCDISVEGFGTKPILTQNSTMFRIMLDGNDNTSSLGNHQSLLKADPVTFPVVSQDTKKVWFVEVDGRQDWFSIGVKPYEMYRIAKKLGGYNMTRFDGGGSSTMWIFDAATGTGNVVNSVSDSKGERSCMNYILIREK